MKLIIHEFAGYSYHSFWYFHFHKCVLSTRPAQDTRMEVPQLTDKSPRAMFREEAVCL